MSPFRRLQAFTFLGALLLFGLEPLVGRLLLPAAGGGFHVWATCLTVFQGTLLLGYFYCHALAPRLGRWHLALVLLPLLTLPVTVTPGAALTPPLLSLTGALAAPDPLAPILSILRALAIGVCLVFATLSTTGVIAQTWLARSDLPERAEPFQLYAASNLGSLAALVGYPILVEPLLSLDAQRVLWALGYLAYAGLAFLVVPRGGPAPAPPAPEAPAAPAPEAPGKEPPALDAKGAPALDATEASAYDAVVGDPERTERLTPGAIAYWLGLAAAPSMCLLAVTNIFALDIGSLPLVWVLPLGLYLLSFVLAFGRRPFYPDLVRRFWPELCLVGLYHFSTHAYKLEWLYAVVQGLVLFAVCLVGHGELFRSRPAPRHLTAFYLVVSIGGWLGGLVVSFVAPFAFTTLAEYPLALGLLAVTLLVGRRHALRAWIKAEPRTILAGSVVLVAIVGYLWVAQVLGRTPPHYLERHRDVYGIYKVAERPLSAGEAREAQVAEGTMHRAIYHGTTLHGRQVLDPVAGRRPISYYHLESPLGDIFTATPRPRRGALIGLGAGATAAYFGEGDALTVYELDPDVVELAGRWFTYLKDSAARPRVVVGDARVRLATDPEVADGSRDIIVVDAFSSDAIPTHLLTREALALYARKVGPGGLIALHISNRYYDLVPPIAATARTLGLAMAWKAHGSTLLALEDVSEWVVVARSDAAFAPLLARGGWRVLPATVDPGVAPWTDDYCNLLGALIRFDARAGMEVPVTSTAPVGSGAPTPGAAPTPGGPAPHDGPSGPPAPR